MGSLSNYLTGAEQGASSYLLLQLMFKKMSAVPLNILY